MLHFRPCACTMLFLPVAAIGCSTICYGEHVMNRRDSIVGMFCALLLMLANSLRSAFGGGYPPGIPGPAGHRGPEGTPGLGATSNPPEPFHTKPSDPGHGRHTEAQDLARALIALPRNNRHDILSQLRKTDPDLLLLVAHYLQEYRLSLVVGVGAICARVKLADLLKAANGDNSQRVDAQIWDFYEAEQQLLAETAPCLEQNHCEPDIYLLAYKNYCVEKGIPDSVRLRNVQDWDTAMKEEPLAADRDEALNFRADGEISIL